VIEQFFSSCRRIINSIGVFIYLIVALAGIAAFLFLKPYYLRAQAYDLKGLDDFNVTTVFYYRHGEDIGHLFVEDRTLLKHDEIPDRMRRAAVAIEDRHFYKHGGLDYRGLLRAVYTNVRALKYSQGASTITQQLAKHLMGRFEKTLDRKLTEMFLARRIEETYSKDEILDYYLNRIYFGKGHFGLASAANGYFGKEAKDLSLSECATLAGIIKTPSSASPRKSLKTAQWRRDLVIKAMARQKLITPEEAAQALETPLTLVPETPLRAQSYFIALAIKELREDINLDEGDDIPQGLSVRTTLDLGMQRAAESEAFNKLADIEASNMTPDQLQVAALVLNASDSAVRVLIGGRDYKESAFDRVRMARRENGAILQPFLYALAFERLNLHPASMINASYSDGSETGEEEEIGPGTPEQNLGKRFLMVQDALALSNKSCAVRVGLQLGIDNFVDWLTSAGAKASHRSSGGSSWNLEPLTLYEITSLYQMLDNEGLLEPPYVIESVRSNQGELLYQAAKQPVIPLLDPVVAQQMTLTLQSVIRDGTGRQLSQNYSFPAPVAGMTGYSEGYRDAWFVGYTPDLVAGIWVG
jgi:penicillin-binding protein 1A